MLKLVSSVVKGKNGLKFGINASIFLTDIELIK